MLASTSMPISSSSNRREMASRDLGRDLSGAVGAGDLGHEDRELVAAEPGDRVARAQGSLRRPADHREQEIAVVVAQGVVDLLEAVEVDEQHRRRRSPAVCHRDGLRNAIVEEDPVGELGDRIVQRQVLALRAMVAEAPRDDDDRDQHGGVGGEAEQHGQPGRGGEGGHAQRDEPGQSEAYDEPHPLDVTIEAHRRFIGR